MEKVVFILSISILLVLGPQHAAEAFMSQTDTAQGPAVTLGR